MKILSVIWGTCSTAALTVDGEVVACASEERFSRIKNDDRYPLRAVEAVLAIGGVSPGQLTAVVFAGERFDAKAVLVHKYSGFTVEDRLREEREYWHPKLYEGKDVSYADVFRDKIDTNQFGGDWQPVLDSIRNRDSAAEVEVNREFRRQTIHRHLRVDGRKVYFAHHHRSHGYYAYYGSPFREDRVLILTADAWGDDSNATVSVAEAGNIKLLHSANNLQAARLYRSMTLMLGMKPDEHEYKVMGLAAYASPEYYQRAYKVFKRTQYVDGLGFAYQVKPPDLYEYFRREMEGCRFDAIAGALQQYTEEILVGWTRNALAATGARRVVFGGGAAMNVKAMMQIAKLGEVDDLFLCPTPSDESLAIGAAYVFLHDRLVAEGRNPSRELKPLRNSYLGPSISDFETHPAVEALARDGGYQVRRKAEPAYVARLLARGKILGRCAGRSEFGARALGNRSILADPRNAAVVKTINRQIKSRDFWMPFAPTIAAHRADDYLARRKGMRSPYMTMAFETSPLAQKDLIAALHPADLTCRPQILEPDANPSYHSLIQEFEKCTGVGGVLNTSFNLHGEPIVETPRDAVRVFQLSGLDALLLNDWLIEKREAASVAPDQLAVDEKVAAASI